MTFDEFKELVDSVDDTEYETREDFLDAYQGLKDALEEVIEEDKEDARLYLEDFEERNDLISSSEEESEDE